MSDSSDDDMLLFARRRTQGEGPAAVAAVKHAPSTAPVKQEREAQPPSTTASIAANGVEHAFTEAPEAAKQAEKPREQPAVKPPAVKHEAGSDSSDGSDDDVPLAARSKPSGNGPGARKAAENGKDEQQPDKQGDTKKPAAAAAKRKSTDGGTKKAAAVNGKAAGAKQQQAVKQESQQESKPAAAAAKKAPAGKADKAAAGGAAAKQTRVKKEFDLPGQTRETPDETDPLRKFYTSLLQEKPESFMAKKWCVMNGLLSREEAEDFIRQNKGGRAAATPTKAPAPKAKAAAKRPAASTGKKAPAAKKSAAGDGKPRAKPAPKRKAAAKRDQVDWDEPESEGADDDDSSSDDDVPLAQRKAAKA